MSSTIKYRSEIDGLRAIAVAAVIVFHIDPSWMVGGFLGVDVFFVISGYLITAIIQRNIDAGSFSISGFWLRRVRRLYPAMMTMVCATALAGNFILIRPERIDLIKQSLGAIFSFSNILLWKTTNGYWSSSSENIPLLHTWSLSLEEQFYVFFPLLLFLLNKRLRQTILPITIGLTIASLAFSLYWTDIDRSGSFYLLPTRLWELSLGSLLALFELRNPNLTKPRKLLPFLATIGLVLIVVSMFVIENDANFPKAMPMGACIGTALVLAFSRHEGLAKTFLQLPPLRFVGKISYSLYLWHWPVIVFANYLSPNANYLVLVAAMALLATASYYLIENPFRNGFKGSMVAIVSMPAVAGLCLLPIYFNPVSPGVPAELEDFESPESLSRAWQFEATQTLLDGFGGVKVGDVSQGIDIMLVGSSHARVLGTTFASFAQQTGSSLEVLATSGIEVTRRAASQFRKNAGEVNEARFAYIESANPAITVVAGMWSAEYDEPDFIDNLEGTLRRISKSSSKVIVLSQVPMMELPHKYHGAFRKYLVAKERAGQSILLNPNEAVTKANDSLKNRILELRLPNVQFVDLYSPLIEEDGSVRYMLDGNLLYSDYHHVNDRGAYYLFDSSIKPLLADLPQFASTPK